jgi:ElaB/YqjD/DUF883 family membrane-anchored ribosome-binding protein
MTSSNVVDASGQNGHEKSPEQIQLEIARTRSAITEDLLALSEKLSPQHLREGAREVMKDAREEAKEILREVKDSAIGSLRDMKDRAVGTVSDKVTVLSTQARQAGSITYDFMSANAIALSLFGLGTGWLLLALRNRRRHETEYAYRYEHYDYPLQSESTESRSRLPERVRSVATRASHAVDVAREQVRSGTSTLARGASAYGQRAGSGLRHAAGKTREIATDNRVAVVALTVVAGLGLGLLMPVGRRPRRALRGAGERVWDEAQSLGREVGDRARNLRGTRTERIEPAAPSWQLY